MASRWDRDRLDYEASRAERGRFPDRYQMRGGNGRDHSDERYDRRYHRAYDDDIVRDRRYYGEEPPYQPRREQPPPPPADYDRRPPPVMERERERDYPARRPAFLRRQSSLDTFDRHPLRFHEREEYPPPARREDIHRDPHYRAPPYTDIPLPKRNSKALPPPRRYNDHYYDDIKVAEPDYYGDEDFRSYPDHRVHEREMVRHRKRRDHSIGSSSRSTHTRTRRGSSPSSTTTSRSSSSSGGTTIRSEYPKKGKTRIPARLVSKRAIIDLGYPFLEEGNTVIVQKALGQANIDELLKLSEEYKKSEMEIAAARSLAGDLAEERKAEKAAEKAALPAPVPAAAPAPAAAAPAPAPAPVPVPAPAPAAPVAIPVAAPAPAPAPAAPVPTKAAAPPPAATRVPPAAPAPPRAVAPGPGPGPGPGPTVVQAPAPVIIDASPHRSRSTSSSSSGGHHHHHHHSGAVILDRSRSRSRSRSNREIRAEIRALERELVHRPRDIGPLRGREIVHAERLPDGQLVVYEEEVEKVIHHHKPPRIEKDKKGRLSLSVPLRR